MLLWGEDYVNLAEAYEFFTNASLESIPCNSILTSDIAIATRKELHWPFFNYEWTDNYIQQTQKLFLTLLEKAYE